MNTYKVDAAHLTVTVTDARGQMNDLNAEGEPCTTPAELRTWIAELHEVGTFDIATRDALLSEVPESVFRLTVCAPDHNGVVVAVLDFAADELEVCYPTREDAERGAAALLPYAREGYRDATIAIGWEV